MLPVQRTLACFALVALGALANSAQAQRVGLTLGAEGRHGSIALTLGSPAHRPSYAGYNRQVWIPGHYATRCERVWIPGCARQVWQPERYEWRYDQCGRPYRVCVEIGRWITTHEPGRYESRETRDWVAGRWQAA